jgi:hypothetical protein
MTILAGENGREAYAHAAHSTIRACSDAVIAIVALFGASGFLYIAIKGERPKSRVWDSWRAKSKILEGTFCCG